MSRRLLVGCGNWPKCAAERLLDTPVMDRNGAAMLRSSGWQLGRGNRDDPDLCPACATVERGPGIPQDPLW